MLYHAMNRAVWGLELIASPAGFEAFERVLVEARAHVGMRLCACVLMPNHFHLVLRPRGDGDLSRFMQWLTVTHSHRWHAHRHDVGRAGSTSRDSRAFRSSRAGGSWRSAATWRATRCGSRRVGMRRADDWATGSLACRVGGLAKGRELLDDWPIDRPGDFSGS